MCKRQHFNLLNVTKYACDRNPQKAHHVVYKSSHLQHHVVQQAIQQHDVAISNIMLCNVLSAAFCCTTSYQQNSVV